jgi:hypothetical protein
MNNKYLIGLAIVVVSLVGGVLGAKLFAPAQTGGAFAGGNAPSTLMTGSAAGGPVGSGYVQPVGSLALLAQNGLGIGGSNLYNDDASFVSASGTPAAVASLNAFNTATGTTATTSITMSYVGNLSVGSICSAAAATTTVYVSGCFLNSTNGVTGTAIVAYSNITGATLSVPTSTRLNITFDQLPY